MQYSCSGTKTETYDEGDIFLYDLEKKAQLEATTEWFGRTIVSQHGEGIKSVDVRTVKRFHATNLICQWILKRPSSDVELFVHEWDLQTATVRAFLCVYYLPEANPCMTGQRQRV